ncbi:single-stranded DNA-binding protein [Flavihumibacter profundi]|jgi:single-strand DNA-binding protein|uniref:single-stranded DNA-binding protein n=1 Tax=Flavihumibacter profundi TaxID=2716883 RepID=UPI001CC81900|nr:single-stranded DNA-binding protein [Flavihumibacter profundi]MBZ5859181.1 single-stranded DNA-binding protein [Flavihumibacter profundi]
MIKLQVIGNLGRDCVTNNVNGRTVMNFTVAHTERYKDAQGNQQERTIWVDCAYWSDRTAIAPYLKKGTQVYVEGTPEVRTYPKTDGSTGASLSLRVQSVQLLGTRTENAGGAGFGQPASAANYGNTNTVPAPAMEAANDDLPF